MSEKQRGIIAASLQTLISIAGFLVAKGALHEIPAAPLLVLRRVPAALLLLACSSLVSSPPNPLPGDRWRLVGLGILAVPLNQGFFYWGIHLSTAAHAALLYTLTPALVLLIGAVRRTEQVTAARAAGIGLALAGVALVLYGPTSPAGHAAGGPGLFEATAQAASPEALLGDLLMLVAVCSWACYTATSRGVIARLGPVRATAWALSFGALIYLPIGTVLSRGTDLTRISTEGWACVVWLILFASVISYLCWYYALQRLDPSRVAVFANLQPIGTTLIATVKLHQRVDAGFLAGSILVIGGVLVTQLR